MKDFLKRNPARVFAVVVAAMPLVALLVPGLPIGAVLAFVAAVLALFGGEVVQRTEDAKTVDAFLTPAPEVAAVQLPDEAVSDADIATL